MTDKQKELLAEFRKKAGALDAPKWPEALEDWVGLAESAGSSITPGLWYITDLRHLDNLCSPRRYVSAEAYEDKRDELDDLQDYAQDFIENVLGIEPGTMYE